jgi:flavin-dependent dehydrogenase
MIDDGRAVPEGSVIRADLCIVGAGVAGWRLSRTEARAASLLHLERRA